MRMAMRTHRKIYGSHRPRSICGAYRKFTDTHIENGHFYVYMHERAEKSPFYVAYTRKTVCEVFFLRMRRKKLRKLSYAYMRIRYGAKEINA